MSIPGKQASSGLVERHLGVEELWSTLNGFFLPLIVLMMYLASYIKVSPTVVFRYVSSGDGDLRNSL